MFMKINEMNSLYNCMYWISSKNNSIDCKVLLLLSFAKAITTQHTAPELLYLDARNQEQNKPEAALPSNGGNFHSDDEELHYPIFVANSEDSVSESLLKLTNFNLAELQKLYDTVSDPKFCMVSAARGWKHSDLPVDLFLCFSCAWWMAEYGLFGVDV